MRMDRRRNNRKLAEGEPSSKKTTNAIECRCFSLHRRPAGRPDLQPIPKTVRMGERIENEAKLREHITAWNDDRDSRCKGIDWQFTTSDARIKLKRLYPKTQME